MTIHFDDIFEQLKVNNKTKKFAKIPRLNKKAKYTNNWKGGVESQVDLTFYTNDVDRGYKYIFVIVDVYSRHVDAVPIKNKESSTIVNCFQTVFNRGFKTQIVRADPGSEFKNRTVEKYLADKGVELRFGVAGRKQQTAIVESMNFIINKVLRTILTMHDAERFQEGKKNGDKNWTITRNDTWVKYLPQVISILNQNIRADKPLADMMKAPIVEKSERILREGTVVYKPMSQPNKSIVTDRNVYGKNHFKVGRFRYDIKRPMKVYFVSLLPGQPVRYMLQENFAPHHKMTNVSYPRSELLLESEVTNNNL